MIKKFNQYLKEEYREGQFQDDSGSDYKVYELLYYAFDWDDNILHMPTEIFLLNDKGEEVGMSTQDFAEYRSIIGGENFEYNGQVITGYAKDSFRYFRDEVEPKIFVKDVEKAINNRMFAKSYDKFKKCLTTGSLFSIITARGHESGPDNNSGPMREGVEFIISKFSPTERSSMMDHLKMYSHLFNQPIKSDDDLINDYLDQCQFIGVSAPSRGGKPDNPEKSKEDAFLEFVKKCDNYAKELEEDFNKSGENWKVVAKVGFSDDDPGNVGHMDEVLKELHNETYSNVKEFYLFDTGGDETQTTIYKKESIVKSFKNFNKIVETSNQSTGLESSVLTCTQFGNMTGRLNPSGPENRQDDFYNQFKRQVDYLARNSKEMRKEIKETNKQKKSSK
jgi:hypothetical protein